MEENLDVLVERASALMKEPMAKREAYAVAAVLKELLAVSSEEELGGIVDALISPELPPENRPYFSPLRDLFLYQVNIRRELYSGGGIAIVVEQAFGKTAERIVDNSDPHSDEGLALISSVSNFSNIKCLPDIVFKSFERWESRFDKLEDKLTIWEMAMGVSWGSREQKAEQRVALRWKESLDANFKTDPRKRADSAGKMAKRLYETDAGVFWKTASAAWREAALECPDKIVIFREALNVLGAQKKGLGGHCVFDFADLGIVLLETLEAAPSLEVKRNLLLDFSKSYELEAVTDSQGVSYLARYRTALTKLSREEPTLERASEDLRAALDSRRAKSMRGGDPSAQLLWDFVQKLPEKDSYRVYFTKAVLKKAEEAPLLYTPALEALRSLAPKQANSDKQLDVWLGVLMYSREREKDWACLMGVINQEQDPNEKINALVGCSNCYSEDDSFKSFLADKAFAEVETLIRAMPNKEQTEKLNLWAHGECNEQLHDFASRLQTKLEQEYFNEQQKAEAEKPKTRQGFSQAQLGRLKAAAAIGTHISQKESPVEAPRQ